MANILYGVNGEGSGHSSRAHEVLKHLQAGGHTVHVVSFDRGRKNLSANFEVTDIFGLRLAYAKNRVRYGRTVLRNLFKVPKAARSMRRLQKLAAQWKIQLVITDFEPLSCLVGHQMRLPVISIDNQHVLVCGEISYPRGYRREAAVARMVTRLMTPRADAYLITSFFRVRLKTKNAFLFPPILRREVLELRPVDGDAVVVYVTSPGEELLGSLQGLRQRFICYGFNQDGRDQNLEFKRPSRDEFLKDLSAARAVLGNAGFSLISEALHLGKPYLAWPVKGQFEQLLNAYYVEKAGYGVFSQELHKEKVELFLSHLDDYRKNLASYLRNGNGALFAKLDELIGKFAGPLR
ncbi:MAG TPA: MJ1255/VC2487 family glycosyltransferase [Candidatus Acidoferrales bacterium]